jgi:hypothetical protein
MAMKSIVKLHFFSKSVIIIIIFIEIMQEIREFSTSNTFKMGEVVFL